MTGQTNSPVDGNTKIVESLGARVRRLRMERGLGQERLAIEAGVDQSGLSKFERGKANRTVGVASIKRLASVLGVSYEEFIAGTDYEGH